MVSASSTARLSGRPEGMTMVSSPPRTASRRASEPSSSRVAVPSAPSERSRNSWPGLGSPENDSRMLTRFICPSYPRGGRPLGQGAEEGEGDVLEDVAGCGVDARGALDLVAALGVRLAGGDVADGAVGVADDGGVADGRLTFDPQADLAEELGGIGDEGGVAEAEGGVGAVHRGEWDAAAQGLDAGAGALEDALDPPEAAGVRSGLGEEAGALGFALGDAALAVFNGGGRE